jgi:methionine synthase I (cobalamin-dependent)
MSGEFRKKLESGEIIVFDGAMGTELAARGIEPGTVANIAAPATVAAVHRAYREAGAEVIITNTFGVNRQVLGRRGDSDRMPEHLLAESCGIACDLARKSVGGVGFVAGDIGPMGVLLEPYGTMQKDVMRSIR